MRPVIVAALILSACGSAPHHRRPVSLSVDPAERATFLERASRSRPPQPLAASDPQPSVPARPAPQRASQHPVRGVQPQAADGWARLRQCESGGDYHNRSNPTFRGGYQASRPTWDGYWKRHQRLDLVGVDPADASPADQDAFAHGLYVERGAQPWPNCGRYL